MFTFQKTLKYVFEAYRRKEIIYKAAGVWKNVTHLECNNLKLSSLKINQNVNIFTMPRKKIDKSEQLKLIESIPLKKIKLESKRKTKKSKHQHSKKKSKRSKKKSKLSKEKSIVSQFVVTERVATPSADSDIVVIFDSKAERKRIKVKQKTAKVEQVTIKTESEDSDVMGNANSENGGHPFMSYTAQNLQGPPWQSNIMDWTIGSCPIVDAEPSTNTELFVRNQNSVIFSSVHEEDRTSSMHSHLVTDSPERKRLKSIRNWKYTKFGNSMKSKMKSPHNLVFTLLSYNVLAQDLLHNHTYLYRQHRREALSWDYRSQLLLREIQEANADIMCLQEVQASHLNTFYQQLGELGYSGIYKKRTGDNVDGVAIYYKRNLFDVVHHTSVEYFQPGVDVLNRHNVGLIAKLAVKGSDQQIVVATTHLLFNPKRHDVKLAQVQMMLAEVERFAFQGLRFGTVVYWPVIITGDMNFEPHSGVYRFLTEGMFRYEGVCSHTLSQTPRGRTLNKMLLPRKLEILDTCQHWRLLCNRMMEELNHMTELKHIKIHNSDHQRLREQLNITNETIRSFEEFVEDAKIDGLVNDFLPCFGPSSVSPMPVGGFATGQLTHNLNLRSVYSHFEVKATDKDATTNQGTWVTVDYIFYSCRKKLENGNLRLIAKSRLPSASEAASMGPIPNMASPSDHYPLLAAFCLQL